MVSMSPERLYSNKRPLRTAKVVVSWELMTGGLRPGLWAGTKLFILAVVSPSAIITWIFILAVSLSLGGSCKQGSASCRPKRRGGPKWGLRVLQA